MLARFGCARLIASRSVTAMTRVLFPALRSPRMSLGGASGGVYSTNRRVVPYKTQQSAMAHCPVDRSGSLTRSSRTTRQGWFGETSTPSSRASSFWARKSSLAPHALTGLLLWNVLSSAFPTRRIDAAISPRTLADRRITHIVSVGSEPIPADNPASGIRHLRIRVEDVDYADLLIHLPSACRFIHDAINSGGVVLVHCVQGLSRSATVVAAYCTFRSAYTSIMS